MATQTERVLFLNDGKITRERKGLHLAKKKLICPHCGEEVNPGDKNCPSCKKKL